MVAEMWKELGKYISKVYDALENIMSKYEKRVTLNPPKEKLFGNYERYNDLT